MFFFSKSVWSFRLDVGGKRDRFLFPAFWVKGRDDDPALTWVQRGRFLCKKKQKTERPKQTVTDDRCGPENRAAVIENWQNFSEIFKEFLGEICSFSTEFACQQVQMDVSDLNEGTNSWLLNLYKILTDIVSVQRFK